MRSKAIIYSYLSVWDYSVKAVAAAQIMLYGNYMKFKAITDFSGYAGDALWPAAKAIHDAMVIAVATFGSPPVTMADFLLSINNCRDALVKKASGAIADTIAFNVARADLESKLGDLGGYVNTVAKGDESIIGSSGFPYYSTSRTPDYSAPEAPTNVVIRQGDVSGSFVMRYRRQRRTATNEVQICTGDPTVEANWKPAGYFNSGKATITGIAPGTSVWARVRTIGLNNVMGAWSDPAKIMVV